MRPTTYSIKPAEILHLMSNNTSKVFANPSINRFTCSALAPLESTIHYLSQPIYLLSAGHQLRIQARSSLLPFAKILAAVMENTLPISIRLAAMKEVGALTRVHLTAFKDDHCISLMYSHLNHWRAIDSLIEKRFAFNEDRWKLAVAMHDSRIAGWLCCTLVESCLLGQQNITSIDWTIAAARLINDAEERLTKSSGMPEDLFQRDRRWKISKVMSNASNGAMMRSLGKETRFLLVNTLAVDPVWKGQGVGSELLRWVIELADREEISIWAQVSPAAHGVFKLAGFEEVHSLVLDLDKYYHHRDDGSKTTRGSYEFKFMLRKVRDLPPTLKPAGTE